MKTIILSILAATMISCTTSPSKVEAPTRRDQPVLREQSRPEAPNSIAAPEVVVNFDQLEQVLNMRVDKEKLGYFEKTFNTCKAGSGYSATHNCENLNYVVIHYRLRCRDTEGTTSEIVTEANIEDIANADIKWTLKDQTGIAQTNGGGYGETRAVFKTSPKRERFIVSNGTSFLYLRANEITTVIAPKNWCN
jgi:hypothetical protein